MEILSDYSGDGESQKTQKEDNFNISEIDDLVDNAIDKVDDNSQRDLVEDSQEDLVEEKEIKEQQHSEQHDLVVDKEMKDQQLSEQQELSESIIKDEGRSGPSSSNLTGKTVLFKFY